MRKYRYIARDQRGVLIKGVIYGKTVRQSLQQLRGNRLYPIRLKIVDSTGQGIFKLAKKITYLELGLFCRQFSTLIKAGIKIPQALKLLSDQRATPHLQEMIIDLLINLEEGNSLYQGLQEHAEKLPSFFPSLVKAGEMTNSLDEVLDGLARYYTEEDRFQKQIKQLLTYPLILFISTVGVVCFLFFKIIPEFAQIYLSLEAELPLLTNCLLATSRYLKFNFKFILLGFSSSIITLSLLLKSSLVKTWLTKVHYRLPFWGRLQLNLLTGRLARSLSLLLANGLEVFEAIELAVGTSGKQADIFLQQIARYLKGGQTLARSLELIDFFPKVFLEIIDVGERTGSLAKMLKKAAEIYEDDCKNQITRFVTILEPGLLLGVALLVGVIVLAMMLPIFDLLKLF